MKRWILTIKGKEFKPKIYAETAEEAKEYFREEDIADVSLCDDFDYLKDIEHIKSCSLKINEKEVESEIAELRYVQSRDGELYFRITKDKADGIYYDLVHYLFNERGKYIAPTLKGLMTSTEFREKYFVAALSCEVHSYRLYGQAKLRKPKEIKGVSQSFSVWFIKDKCKCRCFVNGDDLWVLHRDFFSSEHKPSQEDIGTPLAYRAEKYFNVDIKHLNKFIYADSWGAIVLRNEAWIVFRNVKQSFIKCGNLSGRSLSDAFICSEFMVGQNIRLLNSDWERFFETLGKEYVIYITGGDEKRD